MRYERANAAFDTNDTHDGRGFSLAFGELDATLGQHAEHRLGSATAPPTPASWGGRMAGSGWRRCTLEERPCRAQREVKAHRPRPTALTRWRSAPRLNIRSGFEGPISYHLVQEDRGSTLDARVWLGRARVERRDGPPLAPQGGGRFCGLLPNAQYRIEVHGTRNEEEEVRVAAFGNALKLTEDDSAAGEDKASCSCLQGPHV